MKLEHSFAVPVGIDEAWRILLDIERIGPCMPGAVIDSVDGDDFTGTVKVKLGPIGLTYKGKASFIEKDEAAHRAVIDARGRDARGNGTASAKVTAVLTEQGGGTLVLVNTDLDITGKPAQFGRGVMVEVGNKLIGQFADSLASNITSGDGGTRMTHSGEDASAADPSATAARPQQPPRPKPVPAASEGPATAEGPTAEGPTAEMPATAEMPVEAAAAAAAASAMGQPVVDEAAIEALADAPASFSAPAPAAAKAQESAPVHRPQREVEPINLIESAGPAIAKRLAPVAVGIVFVLIAWRRRTARRPG